MITASADTVETLRANPAFAEAMTEVIDNVPTVMPRCCYIDAQTGEECQSLAVFEIWTPPDPYQLTQSCEAHLADMKQDGDQYWRMKQGDDVSLPG